MGSEMADIVEIEKWRRERNQALATLDMAWAKETMPHASCDFVRLIALHKMRVECTDLHKVQRLDSIEWLRERGFRRINGLELPPVGVLPE